MTPDPAVPTRHVSWLAGADVSADRVVQIWAQVARHSRGAPVSVAHVCAAAETL
jgi:hypothetical protein